MTGGCRREPAFNKNSGMDTAPEREEHDDDGTSVPYSIVWRKILYSESVIYRKSRDVERLREALIAKQAELNAQDLN